MRHWPHHIGVMEGSPSKPLAQLLAVIPPGSAHCLPAACRLVMDVKVDAPSQAVVAGAKRQKIW